MKGGPTMVLEVFLIYNPSDIKNCPTLPQKFSECILFSYFP